MGKYKSRARPAADIRDPLVSGVSQYSGTGDVFADTRTGRNSRHGLVVQFCQSVFGRLAGYEDVNDADRLGCDPAMRFIVGGHAVTAQAASTSQMGRLETEVMTQPDNLGSLVSLSGMWIDRIAERRPMKALILDMDSSVSPTHGDQKNTASGTKLENTAPRGGEGRMALR
jgi:hypothetical protein